MTLSYYIKSLLMDELRWRTNLSDPSIMNITTGFSEKIFSRRHTVVPTYLTDEMYEAARQVIPGIGFKQANDMYQAAINEYSKHQEPDNNDEEDDDHPSFW